jgi:hypothetical protein
MNTASAHVAEVVHFELNSGVEPDACLALIGTIGDWAQAEPGFVSRHVSQGEDGTWVDVTVWDSKENAEASQASFMEQSFAMEMIGMIQKESFSMIQRPIVWQKG